MWWPCDDPGAGRKAHANIDYVKSVYLLKKFQHFQKSFVYVSYKYESSCGYIDAPWLIYVIKYFYLNMTVLGSTEKLKKLDDD